MSSNENDNIADDVDFSGLILGFSSAALYYIGHSTIEGKNVREVNLPLARQNIEIVRMLREKTVGNLSVEERDLVEQVLGDLTAKYQRAVSEARA